MKRILFILLLLTLPFIVQSQVARYSSLLIKEHLGLPGGVYLQKAIVENDTMVIYYDENPGNLEGLRRFTNLYVRAHLFFNENGADITDIVVENDSLIMYSGGNRYSYFKMVNMTPQESIPELGIYGFAGKSQFAYQKYAETELSGDLPTVLYVDTIPPPSTTNRNFSTSSNSGTFEWCVKQNYPRIILFSVSGTDDYTEATTYRVDVDYDYCWIVGRTAPYPGYELIGAQLWTDGDHVLIQDISIDVRDVYDKEDLAVDCITIASDWVAVDHCALSHSSDEIISMGGPTYDHTTVSYCLLYEPMGRSSQRNKEEVGESMGHNYVSGTYTSSITFYRNMLAASSQRNPWFDGNDSCEVINNFAWNNNRTGPYMSDDVELVQIIGCDTRWMVSPFDSVPTPQNWYWDKVGAIMSTVGASFKLYADSNMSAYGEKYPSYDEIDLFFDNEGVTLESSRLWSHGDGMPIWDASSIDLKDSVLAYAGPRYKSIHDERIMDMVKWDVEYYDSALISTLDLPATTKNYGSEVGDIEHSGFDWGTTNQYFDIRIDTVSNSDPYTHTWTSWARITLDENTTTGALACVEINEELGTPTSGPDLSDYVEAVTDAAELANGDYNYIHLRLKEKWAGLDYAIQIDNSQCTSSIDLQDGTYEGVDTPIPKIAPREYNYHEFDIPANPHAISEGQTLTNLQVYLLTTDFAYHDVDYQVTGFGTDGTSYGWYANAAATDPVILHVNTLVNTNTNSDATHGSWKWAVEENYPRIIVFDISGTIDFSSLSDNRMDIENYCWIAGQTAPYPGIEVFGAEHYINNESHILISHVTFSGTDWWEDTGAGELSQMRLTGSTNNVVLSHCTYTAATDGVLGSGASATTYDYLLKGQPLSFTEESHFKDGDGNVTGPYHMTLSLSAPDGGSSGGHTYYREIYFNSRQRNPRIAGGDNNLDAYVNMINCFGMNAWIRNLINCEDDYGDPGNNETYLDYIGNWGTVVNRGDDSYYNSYGQYAGFVGYDLAGSEVYVDDLACKVVWEGGSSWAGMYKQGSNPPSNEASRIHNRTDSLDIMPVGEVKEHLLLHAGPYYKGQAELQMLDLIRDSTYIAYTLMYEGQDIVTTAFRGFDTVPAIVCNWGSYDVIPEYIGDEGEGYYDGDFPFDMIDGYDFSSDNMTFYVNGTSITLDEDCNSSSEVASHINSELSTAGIDSVEAYVMHHRINDPGNYNEMQYVSLRSKLSNKVLQAWEDIITIDTPGREGTNTGGTSSTVLTDATKSWSTNEFIGSVIYNVSDHDWGMITSNTSTTITCSGGMKSISDQGSESWENSDEYLISNPLDFLNGTYQGYYFLSHEDRHSNTRVFPDIDNPNDEHPDYNNLTNVEVYILTNYPKPGIKENRRSWVKKEQELVAYNLEGFGTDSRFAYELYEQTQDSDDLPKICVVDRLTTSSTDGEADGTGGVDYRGSFEYCLTRNFPRIILFETSGTIDYSSGSGDQNPYYPYVWVVGQSAPSPGIDIFGTEWYIQTSHGLYEHLHFGNGDENLNDIYSHGNALIRMGAGSHGPGISHIVMNHCTLRWGHDGLYGMTSTQGSEFTLSNSLLYECFANCGQDSGKDSRDHGMACNLCSDSTTWYRNIIAMNRYREPWMRGADPDYIGGDDPRVQVMINCYSYNTEYGAGVQIGEEKNTGDFATVGSVTYKMNDDQAYNSLNDYFAVLSGECETDMDIYVLDPKCKLSDDNPSWDMSDVDDAWNTVWDGSWGGSYSSTSPINLSGYTIIPASQVWDTLKANAGSKFRDAHDLRILDQIENDTYRPGINKIAGSNTILAELTSVGMQGGLVASMSALPARAVNWGTTAYGDVTSGYNWSSDPQGFTITVNGGTPQAIDLSDATAYGPVCTDRSDVIDHINALFATAGISSLVECAAFKDTSDDEGYQFVEIKTTSAGSDKSIVISSSDATAIDLVNGTWYGQDAISGGYLTRTVNEVVHSLPANPHDVADGYEKLTNLEVWILTNF